MSLSFSQASFALAFSAGIATEKAETFQSRLKQWQKMGFPDGVNVGRGVRAKYGATQLYQLGIMLRLMQLGLTPERAIEVVRAGWEQFKGAITCATGMMANGQPDLVYALIRIDALSELSTPGADHSHVSVIWVPSSTMADLLAEPDEQWSEEEKDDFAAAGYLLKSDLAIAHILELNSMLVLLWVAIEQSGGKLEDFREDAATWHREAMERMSHGEIPYREHYEHYSKTSVATVVQNFDAQAAARNILYLVPENASDPQA